MLFVDVKIPNSAIITRRLQKVINNFLRSERRKIKAHSRDIIITTVYNVYEPAKYRRTYALLESADVVINEDPLVADIIFNPEVAPAKTAIGGYPRFVAGEGPGIGFLRTHGPGFARPFHHGIVTLPSRFYSPNLAEGLRKALVRQLQRAGCVSNLSNGG